MQSDIVIIGGGVIGAAILHRIAKTGANVTLLEKGRFGTGGSTGKSGGFIRAYHDCDYTSKLAAISYPSFVNFAQETQGSCGFTVCGGLQIKPVAERKAVENRIARVITPYGYPIEVLNRDDCRERFPAINWHSEQDIFAIYEPLAGFADPILATNSWIKSAISEHNNAIAIEGVSVERIIQKDQRIYAVETSQGLIQCNTVILAAGAWSQTLALSADVNLAIRNKAIEVHIFNNPDQTTQPFVIDDTQPDFYSRPFGNNTFLVGITIDDWDIDPDAFHDTVGCPEPARQAAARRLSWINDNSFAQGGRRGFDAFTSDNKGLLEQSTEVEGLIIATAWSGVGFKTAPAIADKTAELLDNDSGNRCHNIDPVKSIG